MKRKIIIGLLFIIEGLLFAQGYNGKKWFEDKPEKNKNITLEKTVSTQASMEGKEYTLKEYLYMEKGKVLGKKRNVLNVYTDLGLSTITYTAEMDEREKILNQFKKSDEIYGYYTYSLETLINLAADFYINEPLIPELLSEEEKEMYGLFFCSMLSLSIAGDYKTLNTQVLEWLGFSRENKLQQYAGCYLCNINDDTWLFIYDELLTNKLVLVFMPKLN